MAIRLIDIIGLIIFMAISNIFCVLLGAYIAWRCKENKSIFADGFLKLGDEAYNVNKKRFDEILEKGATEI